MSKKLIMSAVMFAMLGAMPATSLSGEEKVATIVLSSENLLVLDSQVDGKSVSSLILKARELDSGSVLQSYVGAKKPIYLFLNTPGGDIQAGLELIEALKGLDRPVHTVGLFAASMGWQITQSLGERYILSNGVLMSHRAAGGMEGSFGGKFPSQLDSRMSVWLERLLEMDMLTVSRTKGKQTLASYQEAYDNELWITGKQSVAKGYADSVVKIKCDSSLNGTNEHEINFMGILISYETDKCPINTSPMNIKAKLPVTEKSRGPMYGNTPKVMELDQFVGIGGGFGAACLYTNVNDVCASDPNLTLNGVKAIVEQFIDTKMNKKNHVVRMHF